MSSDDLPPALAGMLPSGAGDDEPPPLSAGAPSADDAGAGNAEAAPSLAPLPVSDADGSGTTVMDEMLAIGREAKAKKAAVAAKARREEAKSFGTGMSKGFFSKPKKPAAAAATTAAAADTTASASKPTPAQPPKAPEDEIIEIGADGFDLEDATRGDLAGCLREKDAGNGSFKAGEPRAALARYAAALALRPSVEAARAAGGDAAAEEARGLGATLHGNRAACLLKLRDWDEAAEAASAALSHDPGHAKSLFRRAQALRQLGRHDAAEADLQAVLALDPSSKPARKELAALGRARRGGGDDSGDGAGGIFSGDEAIPTLRPKQGKGDGLGHAGKSSGLMMPEVQAAMKDANPDVEALKKGEWANEDLMRKMAANPRLVMGMQHPAYKAVLEQLQTDPKGAMEKCKADPGLAEFMQEWMGVMGGHFDTLGEKQKEKQQRQQQKQQQQQQPPPASTAVTDPEAAREKALKDLAQRDPEVQKVLADQDIRQMLQDPKLQARLQSCGDPRVLRQNLQDPVFRAQVKKLKEAGLVQIQI